MFEQLRQNLASLLKPVAEWLHALVSSVPQQVALWIFIGFHIMFIIWIWNMSPIVPEKTDSKEKPYAGYQDLRIWASLALLLEGMIYYVFG